MQKLNVTDFAQTLADLPILQFSLKQNKTKKKTLNGIYSVSELVLSELAELR